MVYISFVVLLVVSIIMMIFNARRIVRSRSGGYALQVICNVVFTIWLLSTCLDMELDEALGMVAIYTIVLLMSAYWLRLYKHVIHNPDRITEDDIADNNIPPVSGAYYLEELKRSESIKARLYAKWQIGYSVILLAFMALASFVLPVI